MMNTYEVVIGLEVHVQLATESKLFCSCSTRFGQSPNSSVCEICSAMPGALPSPNSQAVHYAVLAGLATHCRINRKSVFARKNYFYPDLPPGYQISQFELPICQHGYLEIDSDGCRPKRIGITRIHLENDAGKNIHDPEADKSYVDLNRAGTPLVEIVSEPDMNSATEAVRYLKNLYGIVTYLGLCDGNMEEGSFRCDANVSLRKKGDSQLGVRTELKNLNSFRHVLKAIEFEAERQAEILDAGNTVIQETRLYDPEKNCTHAMRSKEEAQDYRYFPDPDILPIAIGQDELEKWTADMPELPQERQRRFMELAGLPQAEAEVLVQTRAIADFFESAAALCSPKRIASLVLGPLLRECNARGLSLGRPQDWTMQPGTLAELGLLIENGTISPKIANDIFGELFTSGEEPESFICNRKLGQISDNTSLEQLIEKVLTENPKEVTAYRAGKSKLLSFFMGQVMKLTKGQANPAIVRDLLLKKLA